MACGSCKANALLYVNKTYTSSSNYIVDPNCPYNNEILGQFEENLKWFKSTSSYIQAGYKASLINKYIGIVLTSINSHNKCYYKDLLDEIQNVIDQIIIIRNG